MADVPMDDYPVDDYDDDDRAAYIQRAAALLELGRLDEAEQIAQRLLATDPDDLYGLSFLMAVRELRADFDGGIATARRLAASYPDLRIGHQGLAGMLLQAGNFQEAIAPAERAAELAPEDPLALTLLALALSSDERRIADAARTAEEAQRLNPELGGPWLAKAQAHMTGRRWPEAVRMAEHAVSLEPTTAPYRLSLGIAYLRNEQLDEGDEQLRILLHSEPTPAMLRWVRLNLIEMGVPDKLRPLYDDVCHVLRAPDVTAPDFTTTDPELADLRAAYAAGLVALDRYDEAARLAKDLLRDIPGHQQARLVLGHVAECTGELPEAVRIAEELQAEGMRNCQLRHILTHSYQRMERYEDALVSLAEAAEAHPTFVEFPLRQAHVLEAMGRTAAALSSALYAVELDPNHEDARATAERLAG